MGCNSADFLKADLVLLSADHCSFRTAKMGWVAMSQMREGYVLGTQLAQFFHTRIM